MAWLIKINWAKSIFLYRLLEKLFLEVHMILAIDWT